MILKNGLFLEPFVHISICHNKVLLYNTLNGKVLEYAKNTVVFNLIKRLDDNKNLLVVNLSSVDLTKTEISDFIKKLRANYMGDIIHSPSITNRPIQIKPLFNIQKDLRILKESKDVSFGTRVMQNVTDITIYINDVCDLRCINCFDSYKQFHYCTKYKNSNLELSIIDIKKILNDLVGSKLKQLNITGGNILLHSKIKELLILFKDYQISTDFYIYYKNIFEKKENIYNLFIYPNFVLNILVDYPIDIKVLSSIQSFKNIKGIKINYSFSVDKIENLFEIEKIINTLNIENHSISPFFNKKNLSFFKKYVFNNKKDVLEAKPSITDLYTRQVINDNYFGKLIIMCDGSVFANLNEKTVGNIKSDSLHKVAYKEMKGNKSWRKTRNNIVPCKICLYKHICPSISNYEYVLERYNLCNIVK